MLFFFLDELTYWFGRHLKILINFYFLISDIKLFYKLSIENHLIYKLNSSDHKTQFDTKTNHYKKFWNFSHKENSWDNTFQIQLWKYVDISVKYTDRLIGQIDTGWSKEKFMIESVAYTNSLI